MMTHILSKLSEEYQTIVEILEDVLDDEDNPLTIERICDKLSVKFYQMNKQSGPITSREYEKSLYLKSQYKGTYKTCGKYEQKGKYLQHKEVANVPKIKLPRQTQARQERLPEDNQGIKEKINKNKDNNKKCNYCKMKNHEEKNFYKEEEGGKIICKQHHRRRNLRRNIYR